MSYLDIAKKTLESFDRRSIVPPPLIVLTDLYGIPSSIIAKEVDRSPHQITYYRQGHTELPNEVSRELNLMIWRVQTITRRFKPKTDGCEVLAAALHLYIDEVLKT